SNAPGLRSGFVAGDARALERFLAYRTYHGCAMSPAVQVASIAAWSDETHVIENRRRYAHKFEQAHPRISQVLPADMPRASFYLWAQTPGDDVQFASRLYAEQNVTVLPGSFLARAADGSNPGAGYVRIALVAEETEVVDATQRIVACVRAANASS
ncbi:MAG TPA: aminotransferase class I/II-fold pyridoxal phosphate-dependent enzyme, partial [Burkholderiaceae bacterium]|nr:aminotransferase class I/II-fold pyridoxal phosphate-dependent enzyme [Burkholderiaceae bacterium]